MDLQTLLNFSVGAALGVGGWFARRMWDAMDGLRTDVSRLREDLPKTYITKADFRDDFAELKRMLRDIDAKIDRKSDKP